jgi:hypothetical protein
MNSAVDITNYLPYLALLVGGGVLVVPASHLVKKLFGLQSAAYIHTMVAGISMLIAIAAYILKSKNLPVDVLGLNFSVIYTVSQFIYKYGSYATDFLNKVSAYNASQKATIVADAAVAAVNVPATLVASASVTTPTTGTNVTPAATTSTNVLPSVDI